MMIDILQSIVFGAMGAFLYCIVAGAYYRYKALILHKKLIEDLKKQGVKIADLSDKEE